MIGTRAGTLEQNKEKEMEKVKVRECRDCGARYATSGMTTRHRQATGHDAGWKTVTELRPKREYAISYQPGYGPANDDQ